MADTALPAIPREVDPTGVLERLRQKLQTALSNLGLVENLGGKELELDFSGTTEIVIVNPFRDGTIPTRWIVSDVITGTLTPARGGTPWTRQNLYLKNSSGGTVKAKIIFFR